MMSSSSVWYGSKLKLELFYLLLNLAEIWHMGQFQGADFAF